MALVAFCYWGLLLLACNSPPRCGIVGVMGRRIQPMSEIRVAIDEARILEQTKSSVNALMKFLNKHKKESGPDFALNLSYNILAAYIGAIVYQALDMKPTEKLGQKEMLEFVQHNFLATKILVQNSVSSGMAGAVSSYAKQPMEYYCTIKTVPPVANKEPC